MSTAQAPISLYIDWLSQPSRAVAIFCDINKIAVDISEVKILKRQVRSTEFKKMNPNMRVPVIKDGSFVLYESHAILRYLCSKPNVASQWYPTDPKERALVDQYLDWHHTNTRQAGNYIFNFFVLPQLGVKPQQNKEAIYKLFTQALSLIENSFLGDKDYLASTKNATIADISCYCEITQVKLIDFDFSRFPKILKWMERLNAQFPQLAVGHDNFNKFAQKHQQKPNL